MKVAWRYLAIGAAAYVLILVAGFPASHARSTLQSALPGLQLAELSGSVFSGHASRAIYRGIDLGKVDWHFRPLALFSLRLEYHLEFTQPDNHGHLNIGLRPGGEVVGHDLELRMQSDRLLKQLPPVLKVNNMTLPIGTIESRGTFDLVLERFVLVDQQLRQVTGTAAWQQAAIDAPLELPLGEVRLALETRDDTLVAAVTRGGTLGLSGEILLRPDNRYALDLVLRPGEAVGQDTRALLTVGLQQQPDGAYLLKNSGRF